MRNIIRRLLRQYALTLGISVVLFAGFELIIPAVISTIDLPSVLGGVIAMLPPGMGAALSEQVFGGLSASGLLGFGWNHPIAHAVGTAIAVVLGARAVAGEADHGMLELLLAQPIARHRYLLAHVLFAGLALITLCLAGVLATLLGMRLFDVGNLSLRNLLQVATNFFLLLFAIYAVTLAASVFAREGSRALGLGFLIAVVSFLVTTVALLWTDAAFLMPFTLHAYYSPRDVLLNGRIDRMAMAVLGSFALLGLGAGFWRLARRDIP